jgi:hypothetical protein
VDPETLEVQETLDEAFENVVVSDRPWPDPDEDWMPGEFDIV